MFKKKIKDFIYRIIRFATIPIRTLPNFLLIGTQRGGSTSLYNYIISHPNISPTYRKRETRFFSNHFYKGKHWYRAFFPISPIKKMQSFLSGMKYITGEASPDYIFNPYGPERVHSILPDIKLIIILRNPIKRAYSHYYMNINNGTETLSFEKAIEKAQKICKHDIERFLKDKRKNLMFYPRYSYLERGKYINQIIKWRKYFSEDQMLIIQSESLFKNPQKVMQKVYNFLDVPPFKLQVFKVHQKQKKEEMKDETRDFLIEYFKPYNEKLYKFLGYEFDWD